MSDKKERKRLRDTKVGQWLKTNAPDLLEGVGELVPDAGILDVVAGVIRGKEGIPAESRLEFEKMCADERTAMEESVTRRWEADTKTSYWLPNNIRPLTALALVTAIVGFAGTDAALEGFSMPEKWTDLLTTVSMIVLTAYFGGRSMEKIRRAN